MKKRKLAILLVMLCLLLAACRGTKDVAWDDAPSVPDDLVFQINGTCDLVDADGKTLHCGSPNDFYGTIEGKDGYMTGNGAFEFTVPYSAYYRFKPESRVPSIMAMRGLFSELELKGPAEEIEWRLSGWSIKSQGTGATLRFNVDSREQYLAVIELRLAKEAELSMGLRHIAMSGLTAEPKLTIWNYEKMAKSAQLTLPVQNGAATVVFDHLETDQIELIAGTKTERRTLEWGKIG